MTAPNEDMRTRARSSNLRRSILKLNHGDVMFPQILGTLALSRPFTEKISPIVLSTVSIDTYTDSSQELASCVCITCRIQNGVIFALIP